MDFCVNWSCWRVTRNRCSRVCYVEWPSENLRKLYARILLGMTLAAEKVLRGLIDKGFVRTYSKPNDDSVVLSGEHAVKTMIRLSLNSNPKKEPVTVNQSLALFYWCFFAGLMTGFPFAGSGIVQTLGSVNIESSTTDYLADTYKIHICSILTSYSAAINGQHHLVVNSIWLGCEQCSKNVKVWLKL